MTLPRIRIFRCLLSLKGNYGKRNIPSAFAYFIMQCLFLLAPQGYMLTFSCIGRSMENLVLKMLETPKIHIKMVVLTSLLLLSVMALISVANPSFSPPSVAAAYPHANPVQAVNASASASGSVSLNPNVSVSVQMNSTSSTNTTTSSTSSSMSSESSSSMSSASSATSSISQVTSMSTTTVTTTSPYMIQPWMVYGWPRSTLFVGSATYYGQAIALNGPQLVTVSSIVVSPTTPQTIVNVFYNGTVIQLTFSSTGPVIVTVHSSVSPIMVYADSRRLIEVTSTSGLTTSSNAWFYDTNTAAVTVYADPSSITLFYQATGTPAAPLPPSSNTSTPSTDYALVVGAVIILAIAGFALVKRRKTQPTPINQP